jgi:hypothetical protein
MTQNNWLKIAQIAEQTSEGNQQAVNAVSGKNITGTQPQQPDQRNQTQQKPPQKSDQNNQIETARIRQEAIADIARSSLPSLNESLHFLSTEIMSRDDVRLPKEYANLIAVEIMAAWLAASRNGTVSDLASVVMKSARINNILGSAR